MLSLVPLMGTCIYLYNLFQADIFKLLMKSNVGYGIQAIAALCLESYIVQYVLFTDKINYLFPLNIIILVVEVILLAYAVRTLGRTFKQLFEKKISDGRKSLDWFNEIIQDMRSYSINWGKFLFSDGSPLAGHCRRYMSWTGKKELFV